MAKFHLKLAHLYGDLLNTYSDIGNIIALQYYGKIMDAEIESRVISIDNQFDPDAFDMALFGGGAGLRTTSGFPRPAKQEGRLNKVH